MTDNEDKIVAENDQIEKLSYKSFTRSTNHDNNNVDSIHQNEASSLQDEFLSTQSTKTELTFDMLSGDTRKDHGNCPSTKQSAEVINYKNDDGIYVDYTGMETDSSYGEELLADIFDSDNELSSTCQGKNLGSNGDKNCPDLSSIVQRLASTLGQEKTNSNLFSSSIRRGMDTNRDCASTNSVVDSCKMTKEISEMLSQMVSEVELMVSMQDLSDQTSRIIEECIFRRNVNIVTKQCDFVENEMFEEPNLTKSQGESSMKANVMDSSFSAQNNLVVDRKVAPAKIDLIKCVEVPKKVAAQKLDSKSCPKEHKEYFPKTFNSTHTPTEPPIVSPKPPNTDGSDKMNQTGGKTRFCRNPALLKKQPKFGRKSKTFSAVNGEKEKTSTKPAEPVVKSIRMSKSLRPSHGKIIKLKSKKRNLLLKRTSLLTFYRKNKNIFKIPEQKPCELKKTVIPKVYRLTKKKIVMPSIYKLYKKKTTASCCKEKTNVKLKRKFCIDTIDSRTNKEDLIHISKSLAKTDLSRQNNITNDTYNDPEILLHNTKTLLPIVLEKKGTVSPPTLVDCNNLTTLATTFTTDETPPLLTKEVPPTLVKNPTHHHRELVSSTCVESQEPPHLLCEVPPSLMKIEKQIEKLSQSQFESLKSPPMLSRENFEYANASQHMDRPDLQSLKSPPTLLFEGQVSSLLTSKQLRGNTDALHLLKSLPKLLLEGAAPVQFTRQLDEKIIMLPQPDLDSPPFLLSHGEAHDTPPPEILRTEKSTIPTSCINFKRTLEAPLVVSSTKTFSTIDLTNKGPEKPSNSSKFVQTASKQNSLNEYVIKGVSEDSKTNENYSIHSELFEKILVKEVGNCYVILTQKDIEACQTHLKIWNKKISEDKNMLPYEGYMASNDDTLTSQTGSKSATCNTDPRRKKKISTQITADGKSKRMEKRRKIMLPNLPMVDDCNVAFWKKNKKNRVSRNSENTTTNSYHKSHYDPSEKLLPTSYSINSSGRKKFAKGRQINLPYDDYASDDCASHQNHEEWFRPPEGNQQALHQLQYKPQPFTDVVCTKELDKIITSTAKVEIQSHSKKIKQLLCSSEFNGDNSCPLEVSGRYNTIATGHCKNPDTKDRDQDNPGDFKQAVDVTVKLDVRNSNDALAGCAETFNSALDELEDPMTHLNGSGDVSYIDENGQISKDDNNTTQPDGRYIDKSSHAGKNARQRIGGDITDSEIFEDTREDFFNTLTKELKTIQLNLPSLDNTPTPSSETNTKGSLLDCDGQKSSRGGKMGSSKNEQDNTTQDFSKKLIINGHEVLPSLEVPSTSENNENIDIDDKEIDLLVITKSTTNKTATVKRQNMEGNTTTTSRGTSGSNLYVGDKSDNAMTSFTNFLMQRMWKEEKSRQLSETSPTTSKKMLPQKKLVAKKKKKFTGKELATPTKNIEKVTSCAVVSKKAIEKAKSRALLRPVNGVAMATNVKTTTSTSIEESTKKNHLCGSAAKGQSEVSVKKKNLSRREKEMIVNKKVQDKSNKLMRRAMGVYFNQKDKLTYCIQNDKNTIKTPQPTTRNATTELHEPKNNLLGIKPKINASDQQPKTPRWLAKRSRPNQENLPIEKERRKIKPLAGDKIAHSTRKDLSVCHHAPSNNSAKERVRKVNGQDDESTTVIAENMIKKICGRNKSEMRLKKTCNHKDQNLVRVPPVEVRDCHMTLETVQKLKKNTNKHVFSTVTPSSVDCKRKYKSLSGKNLDEEVKGGLSGKESSKENSIDRVKSLSATTEQEVEVWSTTNEFIPLGRKFSNMKKHGIEVHQQSPPSYVGGMKNKWKDLSPALSRIYPVKKTKLGDINPNLASGATSKQPNENACKKTKAKKMGKRSSMSNSAIRTLSKDMTFETDKTDKQPSISKRLPTVTDDTSSRKRKTNGAMDQDAIRQKKKMGPQERTVTSSTQQHPTDASNAKIVSVNKTPLLLSGNVLNTNSVFSSSFGTKDDPSNTGEQLINQSPITLTTSNPTSSSLTCIKDRLSKTNIASILRQQQQQFQQQQQDRVNNNVGEDPNINTYVLRERPSKHCTIEGKQTICLKLVSFFI